MCVCRSVCVLWINMSGVNEGVVKTEEEVRDMEKGNECKIRSWFVGMKTETYGYSSYM